MLEDGEPQQVTSFSLQESGIAAELLIDVSGSMTARLPEAKRAAAQFVRQMGPTDITKVVQFDDKVTPLSGVFDRERAARSGHQQGEDWGATALNNAAVDGAGGSPSQKSS